jgi:cell division protease FtsH
MVAEFGMSEKVGPVVLARPGAVFLGADGGLHNEGLSPEVAAAADAEVRRFVETAEERAEQVLTAQRDALTQLAGVLLEREELDGGELRAELAAADAPPAAAATRADP